MADENENPPKDTPPAGGNPADEQGAADPEKAGDKTSPAADAQGGAGGGKAAGGDTPPANGGAAGGGGGGGANNTPLSTALNPQIVQAVGTTNHAVLNGAGPGANGIAYQKVAQAAAYAVQDSTDYMRNIMSMASATTGVALQKMLVENNRSLCRYHQGGNTGRHRCPANIYQCRHGIKRCGQGFRQYGLMA